MRTFLTIILATLTLVGCKSESHTSPAGAHLQFSAMTSNVAPQAVLRASSRSSNAEAQTLDFHLGGVGSTAKFMFLLQNSGREDATNINLSSDNPNVLVVPSQIAVVHPQKNGGMTPIVQIEILHGFGSNNFGEHDILSPGLLSFTITATSDQDTLHASMGANVLVTNYTVTRNDDVPVIYSSQTDSQNWPIGEDSYTHTLEIMSGSMYVDPLPYQDLPVGMESILVAENSPYVFANTGNCTITIKHAIGFDTSKFETFEIPPGESRRVPCRAVNYATAAEDGISIEIHTQAMFSPSTVGLHRTGAHLFYAYGHFTLPPPG